MKGHRRALTVAHHAAFHTRLALGELDAARANVDAALELARLLEDERLPTIPRQPPIAV